MQVSNAAASRASTVSRRRLMQASAAGGMTLLLGACGNKGKASSNLPTVRLQALDGGMSALSLRVVEEEGLDEKHGFKGDFQYVSADASSQNFRGHESDIAFDIGPPDVGVMNSKGDDVVIFSGNTRNHLRIICRSDAPYKTIEDLKGKRLGHYGDDSTGTLSLAMLLDKYHGGLDLQKDFKLSLASPAALVPLLGSGEVDAILSFEPYVSGATEKVKGGIKEVYDLGADWKKNTGGILWTTTLGAFRSWLRKHPKLAKAVLAAWRDAAKLMNDRPEDITGDRAYRDLLGLKRSGLDTFEKYLKENKLFAAGLTSAQARNIEHFLQLMAKQGKLFKKAPRGVAQSLDSVLR